MPEETAMQILGHSTAEVSQRYDRGVLTEQQKRAVNSIPSAVQCLKLISTIY